MITRQSLLLLLCLGACAHSDLSRLRKATQPYQQLDKAVASGYARDVPTCFIHEHHGAMGYHHVNRAYVDNKIEIEKPEILLYEKQPDGKYNLTAVEYIIPYRVWPADSTPPKVFGQTMLHENNLKIWSLHVWAWKKNSQGLFADFNPDVQCPPDNRTVFTPAH